MDASHIISLVAAKTGSPPVRYEQRELVDFSNYFANEDIRDYLTRCLPTEGYSASGISVHNLDRIRAEVCEGASPGGFIFPHGYVVIASSIGGNAVCFHSSSGQVVWADHTSFSNDTISYKDQTTGKWCYLPFTSGNIHQAVVQLSNDIESFLENLLHDRFGKQLDKLD